MDRRSFLGGGAASLLLAGFPLRFSAAARRQEEKPGTSPKKLLFWDLARLDHWDNVERVQGEPRFRPEAVYTDPGGGRAGVIFPSVWRDPAGGPWRMVYSLRWSPFTLMLAESDDGIRWRPAPRPDIVPEGGKIAPHHLFTLPSGEGSGVYRDPVAADGFPFKIFARVGGEPALKRALADPGHPWHAVAAAEGAKRYISDTVTLVSRDGIAWSIKPDGRWDQKGWHPEPPVFAFYNPKRRRHVLTARPGWGDRRVVLRETEDFRTWEDPELLFQPDPLDDRAPIGLYGMPVIPYGTGYVGLLWIFHNSSSVPVGSFNQFFGVMDAQLAFSTDGRRFFRGPRRPFVSRTPEPEHGCTQIRPSSVVVTDSEIRIYSEAHRGAHGREGKEQKRHEEPLSAMTLHTLRRDGFAYLRPRGDTGRIQTKPLVLRRPEIRMNAEARFGEVRWQATDVRSRPLEGLSFEDCEPLRSGESLSHPLKWKNAGLGPWVGKPIRLEIEIRNAALYALEGDWHFLDAHDMWMLEDGKAIDSSLFDD